MRKISTGLGLLAVTVVVATGCSDPPAHSTSQDARGTTGADQYCEIPVGPMSVALGARANTPDPVLPPPVFDALTQTAIGGQQVTIFNVEGSPRRSLVATFSPKAKNGRAQQRERDTFSQSLQNGLGHVRATTTEANPLTAVNLAGRQVGEQGTVVLADSGLQTVSPLDFRDTDLLNADPDELADLLGRQKVLPTLKQRTVVLVGIGNTVEPQTALDTRTHNNLVAIWRAIAKHAGAACVAVYDQTGGNHPRANDLPAVSTVTIPPVPPPPPPCGQTVLYNSGAVGFRKNIAEFIDPAAAHEAIGKIADVMRQGRQRAKLIGTTATDNTVEFRHRLGKQRAEAVKRELVGFGISADRIETVGVGTDWPGHIPDIGPDGHLLPGPAQKNRSVVVELSCS